MPPQQGEVSLLTLFADAHYYLSPPTYKPPHHRFDKGSYVYLYHSPIQQRGRIEIANHAGTPEQDAFAGQLDTVKVEQSYKHPCLFTITVDAFRGQTGSPAHSPQQDMSQWHLPTPDPANNGKYMYRLHTIDLYFWTQDDATMFLDSLRRVLQPHQLQILANPHATPTHAEHKHDALNPLVAKLEKAAVSHSSRSPSISTTQSFPGPPTAPAPASSPPHDANYTPMAYNPAAPAAPEPIAHREKTPPPADAADGTGLGTAAMQDHQHAQQYGGPMQQSFAPQSTSSQPYIPGPPPPGQGFTGPPPPGPQRVNTTGSLPGPPQSPPAFAPPPPSAPPQTTMQTTQSPIPSPTYAPGPPQQYQPMASPPPGGYAQFQYGSTSQQNPPNMHQQLYRPTEQEAGVVDNETAPQRQSNMGRRAEKVEKGVNKFFKKLDKKF